MWCVSARCFEALETCTAVSSRGRRERYGNTEPTRDATERPRSPHPTNEERTRHLYLAALIIAGAAAIVGVIVAGIDLRLLRPADCKPSRHREAFEKGIRGSWC
ncbi:hypothetical protein K431DRAFT_98653 [Polychaeton citri CBS 116435]|uniref:Uncharacterized protein n=1 Tax=Polychaeton citri CBS 116435 TaxID=1314669 RepID=A0A9P4QFA3_9PEZI|nr:hypothetical protein K431DRAFT_98653 [Polychaeton citri CBS 116435]